MAVTPAVTPPGTPHSRTLGADDAEYAEPPLVKAEPSSQGVKRKNSWENSPTIGNVKSSRKQSVPAPAPACSDETGLPGHQGNVGQASSENMGHCDLDCDPPLNGARVTKRHLPDPIPDARADSKRIKAGPMPNYGVITYRDFQWRHASSGAWRKGVRSTSCHKWGPGPKGALANFVWF